MVRTRKAGALGSLLLFLVVAGCTMPEESLDPQGPPAEHAILTPDALAWTAAPDSLPSGARMAVLSGDPSADGVFTIRFEVPPGYEVPPHTHPAREHVTIVSGDAWVGRGTTMDRAAATALPPGTFFHMAPGMPHYFIAGDAPVVLQIHGEGPWGIDYVDAADDPRRV